MQRYKKGELKIKKIKVMIKKMALLFIAAWGLQTANAQDEESKSFRFGLRLDPSLNWYKIDNDKKFENAGSSIGFGWGLHIEIKLSDNASWTNGIGLFYDKGKVDYKLTSSTGDSVYYLLNGDDELVEFPTDSISGAFPAGSNLYQLGTRAITVNYAHLQSCIKMKTKEIGYITYFGQFGLNLGIKTKARANDEGQVLGATSWTSSTKEKIDVTKDAAFMKLGINIGFGMEFNISGSTSFFTCLSYNHGFTNAVSKKSDFLKTTNDQDRSKLIDLDQKFTARNIALTIGILF
jgi:hypothetical protein